MFLHDTKGKIIVYFDVYVHFLNVYVYLFVYFTGTLFKYCI